MSANTREWIVVLSFFLLIGACAVIEAVWLSRKGRASFVKSLGFSVLTNSIGFSIGFFVLFVIFGVILAMAWDGSLNNFPMKDYGIATTLILAVLFVPALLAACKRVFLSILKIQTGKSAWLYSLASAALSLIISVGAPVLLGYFILR